MAALFPKTYPFVRCVHCVAVDAHDAAVRVVHYDILNHNLRQEVILESLQAQSLQKYC